MNMRPIWNGGLGERGTLWQCMVFRIGLWMYSCVYELAALTVELE